MNDEHKVKLWFVLSAVDNNSHLKVIQQLAELLGNKQVIKNMMSVKSVEKLADIIKLY